MAHQQPVSAAPVGMGPGQQDQLGQYGQPGQYGHAGQPGQQAPWQQAQPNTAVGKPASVVGSIVRLKLTLMGNTYRRSVWQTIGLIFSAISWLATVAAAVIGSTVGGWLSPELTGEILVMAGAVTVLCWWLVPVFLYGVDATLDPVRFSTFAITRRKLLVGLACGAVVSLPGVASLLIYAGAALAWLRHPAVIPIALVGAVLATAMVVIGSRAITTLLLPVMESRRSREVMVLVGVCALMLLSPAINLMGEAFANAADTVHMRQVLTDMAGLLSWTPMGAPWGAALAAYQGQWIVALVKILILAATVVGLFYAWSWGLKRVLESPRQAKARSGAERVKGLGFFERFGASPVGAIAARTMTYWIRDPRYSMSFIVILLMPVITILPSMGSETPGTRYTLVFMAPLMSWLVGFGISADISYDNTAFALHISTGVSGKADRWGRVLPASMIGVPVTVIASVASVWYMGNWAWLPAVLGVSMGLLVSSLGISSVTSARFLYPVPKPGESPFKQPQGATMATLLAQGANMGLVVAINLPAILLALFSLLRDNVWLGWLALLVACAVGAVTLLLGVRMGGRLLEKRGPEILQKVVAFP